MLRYFLMIISFNMLLLSNANSVDYYVSKNGTDSSSCISSPYPDSGACNSIMYLVDNASLSAGDTVFIQEGIYNESIELTSSDCGSDNEYLIFKSFKNDNVTIRTNNSEIPLYIYEKGSTVKNIKFDGRGEDKGNHFTFTTTSATRCIIIRRANSIWLSGVIANNAQGSSGHGLYMLSENYGTDNNGLDDNNGPKNCIIEYSKFYNNGGHGIKLTGWGTNNNTIRYCDSFGNGTSQNGDQLGMNISGSGYATNPPTENIVHDSSFYNNYGNGITILYAPKTIFYNNAIYSNGDLDNDGNFENSAARGLTVSTDSNYCEIFNNKIYKNAYYGIGMSGADWCKFYNNVISNNGTLEFVVDDNSLSNSFLNNTLYDSDNYRLMYIKSNCTNSIVANNIFITNGKIYAFDSVEKCSVIKNNNYFSPLYGYILRYNGYNIADISDLNSFDESIINNISEDSYLDSNYYPTLNTKTGNGHTVNGGINLSSEGFTIDHDNNTRDQYWDIGAYELVNNDNSILTPTIPLNLRVIN